MVGEEVPGQNKLSKGKEKSALKRINLVLELKKKKTGELNRGHLALDNWK